MKKLKRRTKRIILRVVVILILLSMAMFLKGQDLVGNQKVHQDFGTWSIDDGQGNTVGIKAYCTIELIERYPNAYQKQSGPELIQRYEMYLVSKSVYLGNSTNTWVTYSCNT